MQRHIANNNRRRELRAWRHCAFWTRLERLALPPIEVS